jgi:hypothetical protein
MSDKKQSCWNCKFQEIIGDTFLVICTYFSTIGKSNKDITPTVVDKGCKFWSEK